MKSNNGKNELSQWARLYTRELFAWAIHKTSDRELAEDLVQETFLAAAQSLASFKNESQPKTWLFGILKNKIAEHYRKAFRQPAAAAAAEPLEQLDFFNAAGRWNEELAPQSWKGGEEHLMDNPAFNGVFDRCMDDLPQLMNACIRLKFLDEKKGEEICQDLGITPTNFWQIIHRAKLVLRHCLEKYWFKL